MSKNEFTTTENLIIEVMIARARLGERLWTFSSDSKKQAMSLEKKGWVHLMNGVVENTYRASFTDAGRARFLSYPYKSPNKVKKAKEIVEEAEKIKERLGGDDFWLKEEAENTAKPMKMTDRWKIDDEEGLGFQVVEETP